MMMIMAMSPAALGRITLSPGLWFMGRLCTAAMAAAVVTVFATW
jgi:hypothetical protein